MAAILREKILQAIEDGIKAVAQLKEPNKIAFIEKGAYLLAETFSQGGKLLVAGNGGSLCDANHFAEELVGIFRKKRAALPAIALTDAASMSCIGNDLGFDKIFSRQVEALGQRGDIFVGLTTSGNSSNLIEAFVAAKEKKMKTIAFLGRGGGRLKGVADLEISIDGFFHSDRVQESHMTAIHMMIEMMEEILFAKVPHYQEEMLAEVAQW